MLVLFVIKYYAINDQTPSNSLDFLPLPYLSTSCPAASYCNDFSHTVQHWLLKTPPCTIPRFQKVIYCAGHTLTHGGPP